MMRLKWNIKKTLTGVLAIMLTLGCVLTFIPSEVLASWSVPDATSKTQGVNNAQGNYKVNFNFFGQNLYMPAVGTTKYYYYTDAEAYNNSNNNTTGYFYVGTEPLTLSQITSTYAANLSSTATLSLGNVVGAVCTSDNYKCENSSHNCNYQSALNTTWSGTMDFPSSLTSGDLTYSFSKSLATFSANISIKEDSALTHTDETSFSFQNANLFESMPNSDLNGAKLGIIYGTGTVDSIDISHSNGTSYKHGANGFLGSLNQKTAYIRNYTPTFNNVAFTYQTYIVVEVNEGTAPYTEQLAQIGSGALYTVGGYSSGDTVNAPSATDLINALPADSDTGLTTEGQQGNVRSRAKYICGFYTSMPTLTDGNITYGSAYTFPSKITSDVTVWVEVATENPLITSTKTDLNGSLKGASSGTFSPYVSASTNNLSTDICYIAKENKFYLSADIKSGVTLNFMLNAGVYDYNAETTLTAGSLETPDSTEGVNVVPNATANVSDNTRDYTVALQNDITIDGIVRLGGKTGTRSNQTTEGQGIIIGNYVALDLNGHTLTINGMLHSFGYIYDSVGTGKIIVNTVGALITQMVPYGLFGGDHTLQTYSMGLCPFEEYNFPYIRTTVEILTSGGRSGTLYGSSCINLGGLGLSNFTVKFFGNTTKPDSSGIKTDLGEAMFNTSGDGKIIIESKTIDSLSENAILKGLCYDIKNIFTFENLNVTFNGVSIGVRVSVKDLATADADLEFKRMYFPVSPMVNLNFKSSTFNLNQYMVVMPGSTVTFDENSILNLGYKVDDLSEVKPTVFGLVPILIVPGHSKYDQSGGIIAFSHNLSPTNVESTERSDAGKYGLVSYRTKTLKENDPVELDATSCNYYWGLFDEAVINIYGHVSFAAGNTRPYILAGNINVSNFKDASGTVRKWEISNLNNTTLANINFVTHGVYMMPATCETGLEATGTSPIIRISYYFTEVMKSGGKSYLVDTQKGIYEDGSYVYTDGIFRSSDGKKYIITRDQAVSISGKIDNATTPVEITNDLGNEIVAAGSQYYVYFGGIYNKITDATGVTGETEMLAAAATDLIKFRVAKEPDKTPNYSTILRWNTAGYWYRSAS